MHVSHPVVRGDYAIRHAACQDGATMTFVDFLLARIAEDETSARPHTVVFSGGAPAPLVPNCIGPSHQGDCAERWELPDVGAGPTSSDLDAIRDHETTHANSEQRRDLAECEAKRRIVDLHGTNGPHGSYCVVCEREPWPCSTARIIAAIYADHPDYREEWRP